MGPRDLQSAKTWLRTWDHFPVVLKIDGRELKGKKEKKTGRVGFPKLKGKNEVPRNGSPSGRVSGMSD